MYKTGVINYPVGQTVSHPSSEQCFLLFCFSRFEKWGRTDRRTTCAKTMIPTGSDFGLAEWIKNRVLVKGAFVEGGKSRGSIFKARCVFRFRSMVVVEIWFSSKKGAFRHFVLNLSLRPLQFFFSL